MWMLKNMNSNISADPQLSLFDKEFAKEREEKYTEMMRILRTKIYRKLWLGLT